MAPHIPDLDTAPQAPAAHHRRAGQARHDEQALIAAYEISARELGAWHHIGKDMRNDAPPVSCRRHRHYHQRRSIVTRIVDALKGWLP